MENSSYVTSHLVYHKICHSACIIFTMLLNLVQRVANYKSAPTTLLLNVSSGIESFEGESLLAKLALSSPECSESLERNAVNSELNEDSVEDTDDIISPDEWKQHQDDRKRIVVGSRYPNRNQNQEEGTSGPEIIDLTNDIAINEMLADKSIPLHPDVEVFAPNRRRPVMQDPMKPFPGMFPTFPQPFPGVNRFPAVPFPNQFPQQFPQRPIGQFPVQTFPVFHQQAPQNPMFGGQHPGGQFPIQRPATGGGFGQQTPVLMMTFPPGFPAIFREVRP